MSAKLQAADAIRRLAVQLQGMQEAADILESLGSTEQVVEQAKVEAEKAKKALAKATDELGEANRNLAAARAEAGNVLKAAEAKAGEFITQARLEAEQIGAEAKAQAEQTVRSAVDTAKDVAFRETTETRKHLDGLLSQIREARLNLEKVQAATDAERLEAATAQAQADAAQAQLSEIQGKLRKILG